MTIGPGHRIDQDVRGFAGISSLVSDVAPMLEGVSMAPPKSDGQAPVASGSDAETVGQREKPDPRLSAAQPASKPSDKSNAEVWLLCIGALGALMWMSFKLSGHSTPPPTPAPVAEAPAFSAPPPVHQPSVEIEQPPVEQDRGPSRAAEVVPPTGTENILNEGQIRYCLAEEIRLDAAKSAIDLTIRADVDRFNETIKDFLGRCSRFRYMPGVLERARSAVERHRDAFIAEGRARFDHSAAPEASATASGASGQTPDASTRAIQQRLNELGYDVGTPNGLVGQRTQMAVMSYQERHGLPPEGVPNQAFLDQLNANQLDAIEAAAAAKLRAQPPEPASPAQVVQQRLTTPDLSRLAREERESIELVCEEDRRKLGQAGLVACARRHLDSLGGASRRPDLSGLPATQQQSMETACVSDKSNMGPAVYDECLERHLARARTRPDNEN